MGQNLYFDESHDSSFENIVQNDPNKKSLSKLNQNDYFDNYVNCGSKFKIEKFDSYRIKFIFNTKYNIFNTNKGFHVNQYCKNINTNFCNTIICNICYNLLDFNTFIYILFIILNNLYKWLFLIYIYIKSTMATSEDVKNLCDKITTLVSAMSGLLLNASDEVDDKFFSMTKNIKANEMFSMIESANPKEDKKIEKDTKTINIADKSKDLVQAMANLMKKSVTNTIWNTSSYCKRCFQTKHDDSSECKHRCFYCMGNHSKNCVNKLHCMWCGSFRGTHTCNNAYTKYYRRNIICPICKLHGHFGSECCSLYIAISDLKSNKRITRRKQRRYRWRPTRRGKFYRLMRNYKRN